MSNMDNTNLLNIRQACRILNVHPDTLRRWEKESKINCIRIGPRKDRRYKIEDIYSLAGVSSFPEAFEFMNIVKSESKIRLKHLISNSKLIIFDVGDTLMEPYPSRGHVYAELAYKYGYNLDPVKVEANYHELYDEWEKEKLLSDFTIKSTEELRRKLYSKLNSDILIKSGFPKSKGAIALEIGTKIYDEITSNPKIWRVNNGVVEFLEFLKSHNKMVAILDNWNHNLHSFIKKSELSSFFDVIVSGGEENIRKPDQKIFAKVLDTTGINATDSLYIGNRYIDDVIGPQKAGITPLLYDSKRKYIENKKLYKFYYFSELM